MMGMMGVDQSVLEEIVRRVLSVAQPDKIILFGSAARGEMTRESDIDLLIVERKPGRRHDEVVKIQRAVGDVPYAVDVAVITTERFEATKDLVGGIAFPAHKYGRVLYEAA
jgi:predicted nucleotidyltransferase